MTLCDAGTVNGIAFGAARIVFVEAPLLFEISPAGGERRQLTQWRELVRHSTPALVPGDKALLYTEHERQWTSGDERVMLLPLAPGAAPRVLIRQAADARYLPTGHLAFLRQGTLFVVPFDARTLELRGDPVAVVKDVSQSVVAWDSDDLTLAGQFAISPQGALAYVRSSLPAYPDRELISIDRTGRITPIAAPAKGYRNHVELSPDGSRLAVSVQSGSDIHVFAWDLRRGSISRLAESLRGEVIVSAWSRDDRIAVQVVDAGKITAAIVGPDAASEARPVADSNGFWASSWSPEGRLIGMKDGHLWLYTPDDAGTRPSALVPTTASETQPMWSPDGRWVAYTSDTTGRLEVHMRPFPGPGEAITVSTGGGIEPGLERERKGVVLRRVRSGSGPDDVGGRVGARPSRVAARALLDPGRRTLARPWGAHPVRRRAGRAPLLRGATASEDGDPCRRRQHRPGLVRRRDDEDARSAMRGVLSGASPA